MLGYQIPTRAQLLLLFLQAHLCLLSSLGAGAAGLSFSYDFSIPDPGGIHRKGLTYRGGKDNSTGRVFYSQAPLRLWDGLTGKQASFNTSFSFAMVGGTIKKPNGTRPKGRRPMMAFFVGPWPIPSSMPWYWGGGRIGTLSNDPTSTVIDVEWNTRCDDRKGYDPATDAVVAAAYRVDDQCRPYGRGSECDSGGLRWDGGLDPGDEESSRSRCPMGDRPHFRSRGPRGQGIIDRCSTRSRYHVIHSSITSSNFKRDHERRRRHGADCLKH